MENRLSLCFELHRLGRIKLFEGDDIIFARSVIIVYSI